MSLKPIKNMVVVGKPKMIALSNRIIDKVFEQTVYRSKDVKNKPFKEYSEGYAKESQSGGGKVDLFATGKMMRSLLVYGKTYRDDSLKVGWINPKSAQKVEWNASKRGKYRKVVNDKGFPFSNAIKKFFFKGIEKILNSNVKKLTSKQVYDIKM